MRPLVANIAIIIVFDNVAAVPPCPVDHLPAPLRRQGRAGRILVRGRRIEQRSRALRKIVGDQSVLIDRDACDLGARGLERQRRAATAGILHDAERAARKEKSRQQGEAFLDTGYDDDPAGIGDDAARRTRWLAIAVRRAGSPAGSPYWVRPT